MALGQKSGKDAQDKTLRHDMATGKITADQLVLRAAVGFANPVQRDAVRG